ncbi:MAG: molybdate transport system ATP-binding protein [Actinomycetota bacterium]|nr:molybdate transport system ATP-binding protein [Actinomycetota bacterium]
MSLVASVRLQRGTLALDVSLSVESGTTVAVVGPNGAGKTTLLRALAGLEPVDDGSSVSLDGVVLDGTPAERRPIGVVFQDYLLFPHLSALDNVAFGLRARGMRRAGARAEAAAWLGRVGLAEEMDMRPSQLSGGQAQRVAVARALAGSPRLLLLDEPLSALDATTRPALRRELRRHLAESTAARVLVTHDPVEAAGLADRLVVVEDGRVVQSGTPAEISQRPRSRYVADLVGVNLYRGRADGNERVSVGDGFSLVTTGAATGEVFAVVHPRAVTLHLSEPEGTARNSWPAVVAGVDHEGDRVRVTATAATSTSTSIVAEVTPAAVRELRLAEGSAVWVSVKATEVAVYPA